MQVPPVVLHLKNYLNKSYVLFEGLLLYIISRLCINWSSVTTRS